jgi:hypothetical protein
VCSQALLLEWTDRVVIQAAVRPHSHPVLTLNTRRSGDSLLAVYVHEQLHWWLADHDGIGAAIDATRERWPSTPSSEDGGARSDWSSRLHLYVCYLKHKAMDLLADRVRAGHAPRVADHARPLPVGQTAGSGRVCSP